MGCHIGEGREDPLHRLFYDNCMTQIGHVESTNCRHNASQVTERVNVRRKVRYALILAGSLVCLVVLVLLWSFHVDQQQFLAARNDCERGCIQDSGGLDECRKICLDHPNRYP
jgi:hypothetical protein